MTLGERSEPVRLEPGAVVGNYRIVRRLGRGWEATTYLAQEIPTGARRALRLIWEEDAEVTKRFVHRARFFERLAHTGAVARYHHMGAAFVDGDVRVLLYQVFEYVQGLELRDHLKSIAGSASERETQALALLAKIADTIARVHRENLALGDFDSGVNVILRRGSGSPVFVDCEPGWPVSLNRYLAGDVLELRRLSALVARRLRLRKLVDKVAPLLALRRCKPVRRDRMAWVARGLRRMVE